MILISFFPFLYALLAFNLKTISFTRFLHLAVTSVETSLFSWPGPEGAVLTAVVAGMEAGSPFRSLPWDLHGLQAAGHPSCWKRIYTYSALLEARPYASPWGSLWLLHLLFKQLLGLQRPGCSQYPTRCCLGPSKIKIVRRAVLEVFCNRFPDGSNFVPLLAVICLCGAFGESCTVRGMKKGWGGLLRQCFFLEKTLAQRLSGVSSGVLAEGPERCHSGTAVPRHLRSRHKCST